MIIFLPLYKLKPHLGPALHDLIEVHKSFIESFFVLGLGQSPRMGMLGSQARRLLEETQRRPSPHCGVCNNKCTKQAEYRRWADAPAAGMGEGFRKEGDAFIVHVQTR